MDRDKEALPLLLFAAAAMATAADDDDDGGAFMLLVAPEWVVVVVVVVPGCVMARVLLAVTRCTKDHWSWEGGRGARGVR